MSSKLFSDSLLTLDKELIVKVPERKFFIPPDIQKKIDEHWTKLAAGNRNLRRGEVFTIAEMSSGREKITVNLEWSDYAHYLYSRQVGLPEKYACRNLHTSCLVEASDNFFVFGRMGKWTAMPGNIQCIGGGLDKDDFRNGFVDLKHNIKKELLEEVGIDLADKSLVADFGIKYLKYSSGPNTAAAIFILKLKITAHEFAKQYGQFEDKLKADGLSPEFGEIVYLKANKNEIEKFIMTEKDFLDHYMAPLLEKESE